MSGSSSSSPRISASSSSVDVDFEHVVAGLRLPAWPCARLPRRRLANRVAGIAVALPRAALLLVAEAEARDVDLRQRDGDGCALAADHLALRDVLLRSCLIFPLTMCLKRE